MPDITLLPSVEAQSAAKQSLLDMMAAYPDGSAKSAQWLLRMISDMYRSKLMADMVAAIERHDSQPMFEYLVSYCRASYGMKNLVAKIVASILVTAKARFLEDPRITLFVMFLTEQFSTATLTFCLKLGRLLDEATIGPNYCCAMPR